MTNEETAAYVAFYEQRGPAGTFLSGHAAFEAGIAYGRANPLQRSGVDGPSEGAW